MNLQVCFFEDEYLENFHPLTLTRPVYDLRIGIFTLGEKWKQALKSTQTITGTLRQHLKGVFSEIDPKSVKNSVLWINPRFIPVESLINSVKDLSAGEALMNGDELIAALVSPDIHQQWYLKNINLKGFHKKEYSGDTLIVVENSWELFQLNGSQIIHDVQLLQQKPIKDTSAFPHAVFMNPDQIYVEEGAIIEPGAMLLASEGPIYVGKNAHIMANSVVRGPSAICENSVVKMGAKIYKDTTVGPVCKVGGEISNVIFHSYSNKAHDGYAGNSVFGQWCNIGADTNTSNLKNNYSTVKVMDWKTNKEIDTGQQFIGTIMGDHSKTGINSMLNTGTLCGVCCNLFSDGYPPKYVPSFSWVSGQNIVPYHFEKAVDAMEKMMDRRSVKLTQPYFRMMKALFQSTSF
ncbi:MAG: putative sugar nucleotidyl transferase [Balneolaceae bacterium]